MINIISHKNITHTPLPQNVENVASLKTKSYSNYMIYFIV